MSKRWSKTELAELERLAANHSSEELAERFETEAITVRSKLSGLGLRSTDMRTDSDDGAIQGFTDAIRLLHDQKWSDAIALFEKVIRETDGLQLADRARQYLKLCRRRSAPVEGGRDPYLEAVFEKNRGNLVQAVQLCLEHGSTDEEERYAYLMASIRALEGSDDEALELLETAIRLEPKNRVHAFHDSDFQTLRGREEFSQLIQAP